VTQPVSFDVDVVCKSTNARAGRLTLPRGVIHTPVFMPVGTQAAIRAMAPLHLRDSGAEIILANTYHLHQRPGEGVVEKLGGLHRFMGVDLPILTDSGGFQVFSLDKKEVTEEGVGFAFAVDGKRTFLSPERAMAIQQRLGADIAMAFDECLHADASWAETSASVDRTARWAARSLSAHERPDQSLFGIVQGGMYPDLRRRSVDQITSLAFDGFAIGGLSVGEGPEKMNEMLATTMPHMPPRLPRYLMGVGRPQDLVDGVALGVDMFDCVIPTRHARGGSLYTFQGRIRITHGRYRRDAYPIDTACGCYTCSNFSRGYLHHLFTIGEVLGSTLATIHNLRFFGDLMRRVREAIAAGGFAALRRDIKALYPERGDAAPRDDDREDERRGAQERMADVAAEPPRPAPASVKVGGYEIHGLRRPAVPERPQGDAPAPPRAGKGAPHAAHKGPRGKGPPRSGRPRGGGAEPREEARDSTRGATSTRGAHPGRDKARGGGSPREDARPSGASDGGRGKGRGEGGPRGGARPSGASDGGRAKPRGEGGPRGGARPSGASDGGRAKPQGKRGKGRGGGRKR